MELDVRHLRVLCAVAEAGSLTRAAAALRLTQPGLSAQVRRIEASLGAPVFQRSGAGMTPTAFGEVVLTRARAMLPAFDDLIDVAAVAARTGRKSGRFRIGSINSPLIGGVLDGIRELYPEARVLSRAQGSPVPLVADVAEGRLDVAVVGDSPGYPLPVRPGVALAAIATEPAFVALPATHRQAAEAVVELADLADEDWAVPHPDDDRTWEYWATTFTGQGQRMRTVHEAEGRLLAELVRTGHAVSLCQPTFEEVPGLVVRPIAGDPIWYRHLLAWHEDGPLADGAATLVAHAEAAYQAAAERSEVYLRWLADQAPA
jgi:DNA-binding transcriptional LysR family regulator